MNRIKVLILVLVAIVGHKVLAQMPKHIGEFALVQQYYNPALTAAHESSVKLLHRNQWTGVEGAPRSFFFSAELDAADLSASGRADHRHSYARRQRSAHHAFGFSVWHHAFGAFRESQATLAYSARVALANAWSLRAGATASLDLHRLNLSDLTIEYAGDPVYAGLGADSYYGQRLNVGLGLALTNESFYLAYGLQDLARAGVYSGDEIWRNTTSVRHLVQAGARRAVSEQLSVVANSMFQYDGYQRSVVDVQVKSVFIKTFWVGAGYRHRLAYTATAGFLVHTFKLGYLVEMPHGRAAGLQQQTHEIALTMDLFGGQPHDWRRRHDLVTW